MLGRLPRRYQNFRPVTSSLSAIIEILSCGCKLLITIEDHSSLMIGYYKNTRENPRVRRLILKIKKIRDRVDSEGQYGRWKLRVMGSWDTLSTSLVT